MHFFFNIHNWCYDRLEYQDFIGEYLVIHSDMNPPVIRKIGDYGHSKSNLLNKVELNNVHVRRSQHKDTRFFRDRNRSQKLKQVFLSKHEG